MLLLSSWHLIPIASRNFATCTHIHTHRAGESARWMDGVSSTVWISDQEEIGSFDTARNTLIKTERFD